MLANNPSVLTGGGVATNVVNGTFQLIGPTGSIALTAQGTNQNITLKPSGTGEVKALIAGGVMSVDSSTQYAELDFMNSGVSKGWIYWNNTASTFNLGSVANYPVCFLVNSVEKARFAATTGNLLIGTTTDSSNGAIQLANHTISAFGIGFGPDTSLYRNAAGSLVVDHIGSSSPTLCLSANGSVQSRFFATGSNTFLESYANTPLILRSNQATALTLDTSQNATFAGIVIHKSYTVATLPAAAAGNTYGIVFVSDATNAAGTGIGTAPTGGGAVKRAVYSTGAAWLLL